ncbi:MAG: L-ribulose-5-phosphate 4-epimerase [Oribacterium parvum]|uniref:L-ribulose-5-phosphate 4-epimerase n=1 Tax=Oribacterium parvum TaxID=1501329 RepID=UPI001CB3D642|nr:L-ribulose-5-phosphate 4-epimerase [Oribacterium parvum]MBF1268372.1 L-ribulose-5-phosphate 4-epimerase [Oribacterium parvum]
MLEELKKIVYEANMLLPKYGLVTFTWGNVSGIDREKGLMVIKPSGVEYEKLRAEDMVVLKLTGEILEGELNPSSDTKTHLELYKAFPSILGVVHTHSPYAVGFAQAGEDIPCMGTTQCDYFYGNIPCVRHLSGEEIEEDYERNTGLSIVETFKKNKLNPDYIPACICQSHGPFAWGKSPFEAVHNAVVMEEVAKMDFITKCINPKAQNAPGHYIEKHFSRKHGPNAYYGQNQKK